MACTSCRQKAQAKFPGVKVKRLINEPDTDPAPEIEVYVEFTLATSGTVSYRAPSGKTYRFAAGPTAVQKMNESDALFFGRLSGFRIHPA